MKFSRFIVISLFFVIAGIFIHRIYTSPFEFDESVNLILVRNLYSTGLYRTYERIFDQVITTGPTVLIPAALSLISHQVYFPRVVVAVYSLMLLCFVTAKILKTNILKIIFLLLFMLTPYSFYFSTHVLGEIPALLFSLVSLYFLNNRKYLLSGIFFTLAIFTKNIFILSIIPCTYLIWTQRRTIEKRNVLQFIVPIIFINLIWEYYRFYSFGFSHRGYIHSVYLMLSYQKGLSQIHLNLIMDRLELFGYIFGFNGYFIYGSIVTILLFSLIGSDHLIKSISLFSLVYVHYFVILGYQVWYRHLFPAVILFILVLSTNITKIKKSSVMVSVLFLALLLMIPVKLNYPNFIIQQNLLPVFDSCGDRLMKKSIVLEKQLETSKFIESKISKSISGVRWFNAPEISYLVGRQLYRDPEKSPYLISQFIAQIVSPEVDMEVSGFPGTKKVLDTGLYQIYEKNL